MTTTLYDGIFAVVETSLLKIELVVLDKELLPANILSEKELCDTRSWSFDSYKFV